MKTYTTLQSLFTNLSNNVSTDNASLGGQLISGLKQKKGGNLGRKFSAEHKKKISDALKGRPKSEEQKRKQSLIMKGHTNQVGEKHSQWKGGISKTKEYKYRKAREWLLRNPERHAGYWRKRYALKKRAVGTFSPQEWSELKDKTGNICLCCKRSGSLVKLEADHIVPLSLSGTNDIKNIQPLCRSCNARKNDTYIDYLSPVQLTENNI